jgi:steroid delta-isomerase-like uncharacterized protein
LTRAAARDSLDTKGGIPMSTQNKDVVRRLVEELWNQHNETVINEIYDDKCLQNEAGARFEGRAGARQFFKTYLTALPDLHCAIEELMGEGDRVALRWRCTGTHKGDLQGIAPTGRKVDVSGTAVYRLANGRIVEEHNVWDTLLMMQQIGAVGQPGQARSART